MNNVRNFFVNLWQRINWRPNALTLLEFILILLIYPTMQFAAPQLFVEDGWVENIQLIVLSTAIVAALRAKQNRPLFVFAAMVVVFMIMRETNMFRGYYCAAYLDPDEMCRWEAFKYGYAVKYLRWLWVAYMIYYFIRNKLWQPIIKYVVNAPIYIWDLLVLGLMMAGGTAAEFADIDNEIMEECCELVCYLALFNCILRYRRVAI